MAATTRALTILDGGMGRCLRAMGAPFCQPEWSAKALIESEGHKFVEQAHADFIAAGAEVLTVNSYALVPAHIGPDNFHARAKYLAGVAMACATAAVATAPSRVRIAGGLSPQMSYRPDLFEKEKMMAIYATLIGAQKAGVDLWLCETLGSIAEAEAAAEALRIAGERHQPVWVAFKLENASREAPEPTLQSGESIAAAVETAVRLGVAAVLFNCSTPEVIAQAVPLAKSVITGAGADVEVGAYANSFVEKREGECNATLQADRELTPEEYAGFAKQWVASGATIIGGCCGILPRHIRAVADLKVLQ